MSLYRTSRLFLRPTFTRSTLTTRRYAHSDEPAVDKASSGTSVEGASGKTSKNAKPKILDESPPKDGEGPEDVQKHNREMDQRAEKPSETVSDKDVENDKVGKGFWSGDSKTGEDGSKGTQ